MKDALLALLRERALKRGEFTTASGEIVNAYVNCKDITLHGPSLHTLSKILVDYLEELDVKPDCIAGVSVGGDPIVAGVICEASTRNWELNGLLVRKEPKSHGASAGKAVDGIGSRNGQRPKVWLIEDVVTSGKSAHVAAEHLRREDYDLIGILSLVDREAGGLSFLRQKLNCKVRSLVKLSEILANDG